jgi:hypothetical protein
MGAAAHERRSTVTRLQRRVLVEPIREGSIRCSPAHEAKCGSTLLIRTGENNKVNRRKCCAESEDHAPSGRLSQRHRSRDSLFVPTNTRIDLFRRYDRFLQRDDAGPGTVDVERQR